jgi:hypothetical protein
MVRSRIRTIIAAMHGKFHYKEKSLLGGWQIEVRNGIVPIGNIRKNPISGAFQYYKGLHNQLNYSFEEKDLDVLKRRIETDG